MLVFFALGDAKLPNANGFASQWNIGLKLIFHQNAKYLALGAGVGQCPRRQNFGLEIPTCWYILALPNAKICVSPDAKLKICIGPDANPRRQSVEYRWRWGVHLRRAPNASSFSSGIWALDI